MRKAAMNRRRFLERSETAAAGAAVIAVAGGHLAHGARWRLGNDPRDAEAARMAQLF